MLIDEKDLETFLVCPRRLSFTTKLARQEELSLVDLQHRVATWIWTYELVGGKKASLKALKEKWAGVVTKENIKIANKDKILLPTTDAIAQGFPVVKEIWEQYLDLDLVPVGVSVPTRYIIPHVGVVRSTAEVVCMNPSGNPVLINYSRDSSIQHTLTNLAIKTKLMAANTQLGCIRLINVRLESSIPITYVESSEINREELDKNLTSIITAIKNGVNYPILNCQLRCPYKDVCY